MVKVYGASDDFVEIERSTYPEDEIGCYDSDVEITFTDGTVIRIGYPKENIAVWWIEVKKRGTAEQTLAVCNDENADPYSDVFEIDAEVENCVVIDR